MFPMRSALVVAAVVVVSSCGSSNNSSPAGALITPSSVVGSWTLQFQKNGRSPGVLRLVNSADQTFLVPGGQPGDNATDESGTWSVNANEIKWVFPESTWSGTATSTTSVSGTIADQTGTLGTFTGCQGAATCSGADGGSGACKGWRTTTGCSATGPYLPGHDQTCSVSIESGWSGYCACSTGNIGTGCGHPVQSCDDVCRAGDWNGGGLPAQGCGGWRTTTGCSGTGPYLPGHDQTCSVSIESGWSGYCACSTGKIAADCGHSVQTCDEVCRAGKWSPPAQQNGCDGCLSACRGLSGCCTGCGCICQSECGGCF
jgi:hypothetical protein